MRFNTIIDYSGTLKKVNKRRLEEERGIIVLSMKHLHRITYICKWVPWLK